MNKLCYGLYICMILLPSTFVSDSLVVKVLTQLKDVENIIIDDHFNCFTFLY